jgi:N-acetylglutamate synthase-like GNAT family acetyltransferase
LKEKDDYVFLEQENRVIACAECKKVQWYQWEISHVSVTKEEEGKGWGNKILKLAESKAIKGNARILQCTIRTNNESSIRLFTRKGYLKTASFFYDKSGNWVHVFQKSVAAIEK